MPPRSPGLATSVLVAVGTAVGCSSSSPTSPGPTQNRMDLMPGAQYTMFVTGIVSAGQPCRLDPSRAPNFLSLTQVAIAIEGAAWVGRAANPGDGDFELRLRPVRVEVVLGGQIVAVRVEGTMRGSLQSQGLLLSNDRIAFGASGETQVEGTLTEGATIIGTLRGEIVHTNQTGSVSCPNATWRLSRFGAAS